MSVKVNLLPGDVAKKERAGQLRGLVGLGFVVLLAVLAFVYFQQVGKVSDANVELAAETSALQLLNTELGELNEFGQLRDRRDEAVALLGVAMADEASFAGIMQDVAAVMPPDAELSQLSVTARLLTEQQLGEERPSFGTLTMTGRSLQGHAPGLERFLLEFDKIAGFSDVFFGSSSLETVEGVTAPVVSFDVEVDLGPETLSGRYVNGLPEGLR